MKNLFTTLFTPALLCGALFAQNTPSSGTETQTPQTAPHEHSQTQATAPGSQANAMKIAPGSVIPVQLSKTVDAKKAKTGDEVVATVTMDMKTNSGDILVPKDTKILGHVTEAQARNKEQKESQLGIAFDRAMVKGGSEMNLPMSIQAIIAPQSNDPTAPGAGPQPSASASPSAAAGASHSPSGAASASGAQQPSTEASGANEPQTSASARPQITAKTEGVIGMDNVKLETSTQNSPQGSIVSSDKSNVKIEKGTMLLLRVNQMQ